MKIDAKKICNTETMHVYTPLHAHVRALTHLHTFYYPLTHTTRTRNHEHTQAKPVNVDNPSRDERFVGSAEILGVIIVD